MKNKLVIVILFLAVVLVLGTGSIPAGSATANEGVIWTQWDADHYALIDDGEMIWVGTGSGLIRWDKASGTYARISTAEGLPHRRVYSGAVDGDGNRWFGGDAGLSRLAESGEWTHYNTSNSDIFSDGVDGIAVTADGSVWLSHNDSPYVSRLRADSSWVRYPNKQTAAALGYERIKQTLNSSDLWAVAGDEVWVGYDVFNGTTWQNRVPEGACGCPLVAAAGSGSKVWVLESWAVYYWDGKQWWEYPFSYSFSGELTTLAVDKNDGAWVGGIDVFSPYSGSIAGYTRLREKPGSFELEHLLGAPEPITALMPTNGGLWGIGPNWLHKPDEQVIMFSDTPLFEAVRETVVDRQGRTWIRSVNYESSALQTFDDMGTATMSDDKGRILGQQPTITILEPAPNGDLWVGWQYFFKFLFPGPPTRYHGNSKIDYYPPIDNGFIDDIFAQDAQHTWFAYWAQDYAGNHEGKGVWSLDDGGTPADFSDDVWASYPIDTDGTNGLVAEVSGHLWYGDSSGLYRYQDPGWEQVSSVRVQGLVPGADGELYVDDDWQVLIVEQDGRQYTSTVQDLIASNLARVQATERRNRMWTVAPDGGVWHWQSSYDHELARRDADGLEVYNTPAAADYVAVDKNNHVWLADGALWRMSPEPDFNLAIGPSLWFMTPDDGRSGLVQVISIEGYQETVELSISGLPAGVTAEISPNPLPAGESAVLTLTTAGAALGENSLTVSGSSGSLSRQQSFTLAVVKHVANILLPIVAR